MTDEDRYCAKETASEQAAEMMPETRPPMVWSVRSYGRGQHVGLSVSVNGLDITSEINSMTLRYDEATKGFDLEVLLRAMVPLIDVEILKGAK